MKKIFLLILLLALLCTVACANESRGNDTPADTNTDAGTDAGTDTAPSDQNSENANEPSTDPYEGWTNVFGKIYIPNLPFSSWDGENQDNISRFTIFISSNDSAAFHAYAQSLNDFGYTIEKRDSYSYEGLDPENREISLVDYENGQMKIYIYY